MPMPWTSEHSFFPWEDPISPKTYSFWTKSLSFSPNNLYLAVASGDDQVAVIDIQHSKIATFLRPIEWPTSVAFTHDNKLIVGTKRGYTGSLQLWNIETASLEKEISRDAPNGGICSVAISPDGEFLASGYCTYVFDVLTWDIQNGYKPLSRLVGLDEVPYCPHFCIEDRNLVAFNPANGDVASGTNESRIPIKNSHTGRLSTIVSTSSEVDEYNYISDVAPVNGLAFTSDGAILVIAAGRYLQLRNVMDGKLLWYHKNSQGVEMSMTTITADSKLIISIDSKGDVNFWGVPDK
jgi:WD40 repeat protein